MLTRRNLRNHKIVIKSKEELKKDDEISAKNKLDDKENQLTNLTRHCKAKYKKIDKPVLRLSVLKDPKEKPSRNIQLERSTCKNSHVNISTNSPRKKSLRTRNYNKQTLKQSKVLQEINDKGSINSSMKKRMGGNKNVKQESNKKYRKHANFKKVSVVTTVNCQPENKENQKRKITKIDNNIPIWKKEKKLNKSINLKRQSCKIDVYDIALDEELIASAESEKLRERLIEVKKKQARSQKRKINKNIIKEKGLSTKTQNCTSNFSCNNKRKALEKKQTTSHTVNIKNVLLEENENNKKPPDQIMNSVTFDLQDQMNEQDQFLSISPRINEQNEGLEHLPLGFQPSVGKSQSKLLSDLANELEKSFLMPKMTSTPDAVHSKPGIQIQKDGVLNITEISSIATTNKNVTVATPCYAESDSEEKTRNKESMADITLFESPTKEEKDKIVKSPKKSIQINLFGEILNSPVKEKNLEDSVLKPNKAYHTPDNFKTHLAKTKRTAEVSKTQIFKKSKEDMFFEKMTQHFNEVSGTELCIE